MKVTDDEVNNMAREAALSQYGTDTHAEYESTANGYIMWFNDAISQMQPELITLKRHDEQLRTWINSMTAELKVLRTALKDVNELSNDEQLSEWLFDQDYVVEPTKMQPEWVRANPMTVETAAKLADTDLNLILCRFDNGQILRYNEDHPFAVLTDLLFIPQPTKDINQ